MKSPFLIGLAALSLTACVTLSLGYQSVVLPGEFGTSARVIAVEAPTRRYKPEFFNLDLGDYRIEAVDYPAPRDVLTAEHAGEPVSEVTVDNTGWNLLLAGAFVGEWVTYAQYRSEHESTRRFETVGLDGQRARTACVVNSVGLENEEVARTAVSLGDSTDRGGRVIHYGEWLATRMLCTIRNGEETWLLQLVQRADDVPEVSLTKGSVPFKTDVLPEAFVATPYTSGQAAIEPDAIPVGELLPGVGFSDGQRMRAAAALYGGNTTLWLAPDLDPAEAVALVASGYALMLHGWLNGG